MFKKFFSIVGVMGLICFSFYYTHLATVVVKNNDPIMKKIINVSKTYTQKPVNATLSNNSIIPGVSGLEVDLDKSYESMKKYGSFNEDLVVLKSVTPLVSVSNIYDKYITRGNDRNNNVALVIIIDDYSYVENIVQVLDSKQIKATFFIDKDIILDSPDLVKLINSSSHDVELKSSDYNIDGIRKASRELSNITNKDMKFCYSEKENLTILTNCSSRKLYTIVPNIPTSNFPYNDVKTKLENGSIITLKNNTHTLRELKYIINYINQKGYKIVTLEKLIKE